MDQGRLIPHTQKRELTVTPTLEVHLRKMIYLKQYYPHDPTRYKQLMEQWVSFAISNDIPLTRLGSLPYALWNCTTPKPANTLSSFVRYIMILYYMLVATLIVTV